MPWLGKPETPEQTAQSPQGLRRRPRREGDSPHALAALVLRSTGIPDSAEETGSETGGIRPCAGGDGAVYMMLEPVPVCAPLLPVDSSSCPVSLKGALALYLHPLPPKSLGRALPAVSGPCCDLQPSSAVVR